MSVVICQFVAHISGIAESCPACIRKQTRLKRCHDLSRDFSAIEPDGNQRPRLAHPGLLRAHWRGVSEWLTAFACVITLCFSCVSFWPLRYICIVLFCCKNAPSLDFVKLGPVMRARALEMSERSSEND